MTGGPGAAIRLRVRDHDLPSEIEGIFGRPLRLRWVLPKVWTQRRGRPFGIYLEPDHGQLHPPPTDAELQDFYDIYYAPRDEQRVRADLLDRAVSFVASRLDRTSNLEPEQVHDLLGGRPARVLEVGCGRGELLAGIAALGHRVQGVEPNATARSQAAARGLAVTGGFAEDLPTLPGVAGERFDIVLMQHVLEHFRDPIGILGHVRDLLVPGGLLVCEVPNHASLGFAAYGSAWFHTDAGRHLHFFSERSLGEAATRAGLAPITFEYSGFSRQFSTGWIRAEQEVWDALHAEGAGPESPPRPSRLRSWAMLAPAALGPAERAHDAVRLIARRPTA